MGVCPPPLPEIFWGYFRALNQLLVQSDEEQIMIELLYINCFIDNTDLVLWLTYILHA